MSASNEPLESAGMIRAGGRRRPPGRACLAPRPLLALGAALLASLSLAAVAEVPSPLPLKARIEETRRLVERLRGVPFVAPVVSSLLPEKDLPRVLEKQLAEDLPVPFQKWTATLSALGLIDPLPDLQKRITNLYSRQVVGFYDPRTGRLYVVPERTGDAAALTGSAAAAEGAGTVIETALLAHELTHALQDQRLGLERRMRALRESTDGLLALQCFLEGEATAVMAEALFDGLPAEAKRTAEGASLKEMLASLSSISTSGVDGSEGVPEYFVREMIFPYAAGTGWIERRRAGRGWAAVEECYAGRLPGTTSEILHPESEGTTRTRLTERDRPKDSDLPAGMHVLYADTLGEWVLSFLLERSGAGSAAPSLAASWQDDRVIFFERERRAGLQVGFLWRIRLSSAEAAGRLATALAPLWTGRPAAARPEVSVRGDVVTVARLLRPR